MDKLFDFDEQLNVGNDGESVFAKHYARLKPVKSTDRKIDFILGDGRSVELKTDTYDMEKTPNFFMEIFGDIDAEKIGGPWRAMQDGVDLFVYFFPKNKTFFWFKTVALCRKLDELVAQQNLTPKEIRNKGWSARGYVVPRNLLKSVCIKEDKF
jgi:hypothetical protein